MLAVTDIKAPTECTEALQKLGFEVILLPPLPLLPAPVASHPDMLIFQADKRLLTHREYYKLARRQLETICSTACLELTFIDEAVGDTYPHDVLFNAATVGNKLICSVNAVSAQIKEYCAHQSKKMINVKQGYTKCSVCIVSDNAIITADRGIASAAKSAGIDVLTISPGHVSLKGYDTGFIGGASGGCGGTVFFCGNISTHPDHAAICDFCASNSKKIVCLGDTPLTDVGTIFFF